jgi:hypothetical protein
MNDDSDPTTHSWETPTVTHLDDARAAAAQAALMGDGRRIALAARNDAIRAMRLDDGMTYKAIAAHMGMSERNVHWIVAGNHGDEET